MPLWLLLLVACLGVVVCCFPLAFFPRPLLVSLFASCVVSFCPLGPLLLFLWHYVQFAGCAVAVVAISVDCVGVFPVLGVLSLSTVVVVVVVVFVAATSRLLSSFPPYRLLMLI